MIYWGIYIWAWAFIATSFAALVYGAWQKPRLQRKRGGVVKMLGFKRVIFWAKVAVYLLVYVLSASAMNVGLLLMVKENPDSEIFIGALNFVAGHGSIWIGVIFGSYLVLSIRSIFIKRDESILSGKAKKSPGPYAVATTLVFGVFGGVLTIVAMLMGYNHVIGS